MAVKPPQSPSFHAVGAIPTSLTIGTPHRILDQGATKPVLFQLEHDGKPAGFWVMKAQCQLNRGGIDILRELAGTELCAHLGLPTPAVALVRIPDRPPATDDSPLGRYMAKVYEKDRGKLAFCSAYVEAPRVDGKTLAPSRKVLPRTVRDSIVLLVTDALIWHYDRTPGNPNALLYRGRVVPIDHDHAFFKMDFVDESGCAPDFTAPADHESVSQHIAADIASQHLTSPAWDEVLRAAATLTNQTIQDMMAKWPDELDRNFAGGRVGWKEDFARFVATRRDNAVNIVEEVRCAVRKG